MVDVVVDSTKNLCCVNQEKKISEWVFFCFTPRNLWDVKQWDEGTQNKINETNIQKLKCKFFKVVFRKSATLDYRLQGEKCNEN